MTNQHVIVMLPCNSNFEKLGNTLHQRQEYFLVYFHFISSLNQVVCSMQYLQSAVNAVKRHWFRLLKFFSVCFQLWSVNCVAEVLFYILNSIGNFSPIAKAHREITLLAPV